MSGDREDSGASKAAEEPTAPAEAAGGSGDTTGNRPSGPSNPELEEALAEAMAAVEDRRASGPTGSAGEAVTEALLQAKNELERALEQTRKEAEQLRDKWMRAAADLENYRRRASKEREDVQRFGAERLLKDFLPVVDDLDRALGVVTGAEATGTTEQLLGGVRLVHKKFLGTLEKHGVTSFESKGQPFNPERHEAVQQAPSEDVPAGAVAEELQRGFLLHDRLLRPALVVVSLGPETAEGS